jgi:hypothetical protein
VLEIPTLGASLKLKNDLRGVDPVFASNRLNYFVLVQHDRKPGRAWASRRIDRVPDDLGHVGKMPPTLISSKLSRRD